MLCVQYKATFLSEIIAKNQKCALEILRRHGYNIDEESYKPEFKFVAADFYDKSSKGNEIENKFSVRCLEPFTRFENTYSALSKQETQQRLEILNRQLERCIKKSTI